MRVGGKAQKFYGSQGATVKGADYKSHAQHISGGTVSSLFRLDAAGSFFVQRSPSLQFTPIPFDCSQSNINEKCPLGVLLHNCPLPPMCVVA